MQDGQPSQLSTCQLSTCQRRPVPPLIYVSQDCDGAGTAICHLATGPLEESRLFGK